MYSVIVGGDGSNIQETLEIKGEFSPIKRAILSGQKNIKITGELKEDDFLSFRIDSELQKKYSDIELDLSEAEFPRNDKGQHYIPYEAFQQCECLSGIKLPKNINIIKSKAFYDCINLKSLVIPEQVYIIGIHAFWNTSNLTYLYIQKNVRTIGEAFIAFSGL